MQLSCTIHPGLTPMDRGYVEDLLCDALQQIGLEVDPIGGGTMMGDPPTSDFQLELEGDCDAHAVETIWRATLSGVPFTLATTITLELDGGPKTEIVVGGPAECG